MIASSCKNNIGVKVGPETVRRMLRRNNYNGRVTRKNSYISAVNSKKRLDYAV